MTVMSVVEVKITLAYQIRMMYAIADRLCLAQTAVQDVASTMAIEKIFLKKNQAHF